MASDCLHSSEIISRYHHVFVHLSETKNLTAIEDHLATISNLRKVPNQGHDVQALLRLYHGAFEVLRARDSINFFMKNTYLKIGLDRMQGIDVDLFQGDSSIYTHLLLVRGLSNAEVPLRFGRTQHALRDLKTALQEPCFTIVDAKTQQKTQRFMQEKME